ncbi:hypothetical protein COW94_04480 [Candidatus Peregrinibacteria bacterium CG22_combo_CG10-13_8_21_14_all_44_10]|nr:MAG: hypothetical protein COW94_04480 [Candidatus Peregrinibacteria bacterium CG22_combo_CG10-13_8_21_14_all_44_10]
MKIGIDLRPLLHGKASGVAVYTHSLVSEMIKHKEHEFVLFLSGSKSEYSHIMDDFSGANIKKVFWKVPNRILNFGFWFLNYPKVDLGLDAMFLPDMRPVRLPKGTHKIVTCHDLSFLRFSRFFSWKSRFWYKLNSPKNYFRTADKVISVSKFTKKELERLCGVASEVVYEGASISDESDTAAVSEKYNLPARYLLSLSTLEPRKNLKRVIEAFQKAEVDCDLVVAGDFDTSVFSKLKLPSSDRVHLIGEIAETEKKALYGMSDGLVYVSLYEGFGLPPLEAMWCGKPVLTSKDSPMEEVCGKYGVYVDPYDVADISAGIRELITADKDPKEIAEHARKFSWRDAAKRTLEIIESSL